MLLVHFADYHIAATSQRVLNHLLRLLPFLLLDLLDHLLKRHPSLLFKFIFHHVDRLPQVLLVHIPLLLIFDHPAGLVKDEKTHEKLHPDNQVLNQHYEEDLGCI